MDSKKLCDTLGAKIIALSLLIAISCPIFIPFKEPMLIIVFILFLFPIVILIGIALLIGYISYRVGLFQDGRKERILALIGISLIETAINILITLLIQRKSNGAYEVCADGCTYLNATGLVIYSFGCYLVTSLCFNGIVLLGWIIGRETRKDKKSAPPTIQ